MTCVRRVNRLDRLILRGADPNEPACRLLVERLRYMVIVSLLVALAGVGTLFSVVQAESKAARQRGAEIVANQCVDRAGDIAFRNLLGELVQLNERRPSPQVAAQRQRTAVMLRRALEEAGPAPACILRVP